jgi:hypothetical protein
MVIGDNLLYVAGRYSGWALLGFLCRVSLNPETCILRSAEAFYKRGKKTLLFAKFIPGINTMAPPLAGSMNMRISQFLRLDSVGAALYVITYSVAGYVFRDFVAAITRGVQAAARDFEILLLCALVAYVAYRIGVYRKNASYSSVPRIPVAEVIRRIQSGERDHLIIADVRSHGYYDPGASRIEGSIRIEPNDLEDELKTLPRDKEILLYCT